MVTPTYGKGTDAATYENPVNATYDMIEKVEVANPGFINIFLSFWFVLHFDGLKQ